MEIQAVCSGSMSVTPLTVAVAGMTRDHVCGTTLAQSPVATSAYSEATESVSTWGDGTGPL